MPPFAWVLTIIGAIGAIVGIIWFIESRFRKNVDPAVVERVERKLDELRTEVGQIAEYIDGLPKAPPKIRDPFDEGRKLEKEYKYTEAIKKYEACFQPETTPSQRAALHILIGSCFYRISELEEGEGHYRQAETAAKEANDNEGLARALGNIGLICQTKGDLDKALEYHRQSLEMDRSIGGKEGEASNLGNIGLIYRDKGELGRALEYHQHSLKIFKEIGVKGGEASNLGNIGLVYMEKGELHMAMDYYQPALKIFEDIGAKIDIEQAKLNTAEIRKRMKSSKG